jgi:hypothetical protein
MAMRVRPIMVREFQDLCRAIGRISVCNICRVMGEITRIYKWWGYGSGEKSVRWIQKTVVKTKGKVSEIAASSDLVTKNPDFNSGAGKYVTMTNLPKVWTLWLDQRENSGSGILFFSLETRGNFTTLSELPQTVLKKSKI